jgi:hypothetical protein
MGVRGRQYGVRKSVTETRVRDQCRQGLRGEVAVQGERRYYYRARLISCLLPPLGGEAAFCANEHPLGPPSMMQEAPSKSKTLSLTPALTISIERVRPDHLT